MNRHWAKVVGITGLGLALLVAIPPSPGSENIQEPISVRIGVAASLFRDLPESMALSMAEPFAELVESQTGLGGKLSAASSALELGRQLAEKKVELGVFQGIELAWARQKYPQLRPLVVVANSDRHFRAYLVARRDGGVRGFADVRGQVLLLPRFSREHVYQFLERACRKAGFDSLQSFARISKADSVEDALDDVVDGRAAAALVEGMPWRCYERRKPGRAERLQVVKESEVFPPSAIVYCDRSLDQDTLRRLRDGMLNARHTPIGRQLMTPWRVEGFVAVPDDYEESLDTIVKHYLPPAEGTARISTGPAGSDGRGQP